MSTASRFSSSIAQAPVRSSTRDLLSFTVLISASVDKEVFEPMIPGLLALQHSTQGTPIIREAWSLDNPAHGEASVYNDEVLNRQDTGFSMSTSIVTHLIPYSGTDYPDSSPSCGRMVRLPQIAVRFGYVPRAHSRPYRPFSRGNRNVSISQHIPHRAVTRAPSDLPSGI